ncbi:hypothetical protein [Streptomyces sp. NPDC058426]|uniref:hypothetical protein n=1 Tax=Streptomyces sp. NPDC058426 TaxID=3346493 RepID=UPI003663E024
MMVRQLYPWLLHRSLAQHPACPDTRCDDGISLNTGHFCESCGNVIYNRRAHRARLAAELDQEQPALPAAERQRALEERLRAHTEHEVEARERRVRRTGRARGAAYGPCPARPAEGTCPRGSEAVCIGGGGSQAHAESVAVSSTSRSASVR